MVAFLKWLFGGLAIVSAFAVPTLVALGHRAAGFVALGAFLVLHLVAAIFARREARRWAAILLLAPSLLLGLGGCRLPWDRERYDRTPAGWHVRWEDQGTEATGRHDKAQLYALFDAAFERALIYLQATWGVDPTYARHKLRENDALYTLVDNFYFPVIGGPAADAPDAQYASGETLDRVEVWVAFYDRDDPGAVDPTAVPADAPSWTLKPSTSFPGKVYYGAEYDGRQYPALGYELHWQFTNTP